MIKILALFTCACFVFSSSRQSSEAQKVEQLLLKQVSVNETTITYWEQGNGGFDALAPEFKAMFVDNARTLAVDAPSEPITCAQLRQLKTRCGSKYQRLPAGCRL